MANETEALATVPVAEQGLARVSELSVPEIVARVKKVHEVQKEVMHEGKHYGKIPGVDKPTLLKPGAEILGMVFRLDPQFDVVEQIRDGNHLTVVMKCTLFHIPTGARLGSGMGSCSTRESKYAYRKAERVCPACGKAAIIKGREEYGGGWVCFKKKDGCGAKYGDDDETITGQATGRVENEDVADQHNTVLKMAIKRAHVAAILFVTCASEIFTQDVEDMPREAREEAPANGNGKGNGKSTGAHAMSQDVSALLADYAQCKEGGAYQKLQERRKQLWGKLSGDEKKKLKAAAELAEKRVLDAMNVPESQPDEDEVDGEFEDDETPHGGRAVA